MIGDAERTTKVRDTCGAHLRRIAKKLVHLTAQTAATVDKQAAADEVSSKAAEQLQHILVVPLAPNEGNVELKRCFKETSLKDGPRNTNVAVNIPSRCAMRSIFMP